MKRIFVFVALMPVAVLASAEIFKCTTPNGVAYSERPCADAKVVTNLAKKPSAESVRRAQARLDNDIRQVENNERQAESERQARAWRENIERQNQAAREAFESGRQQNNVIDVGPRSRPGYR